MGNLCVRVRLETDEVDERVPEDEDSRTDTTENPVVRNSFEENPESPLGPERQSTKSATESDVHLVENPQENRAVSETSDKKSREIADKTDSKIFVGKQVKSLPRTLPPSRVSQLPHHSGKLKKFSTTKGSPFEVEKTRYFRLAAGKLRYYSDACFRPSSLKGVIDLDNCKIKYSKEQVNKDLHKFQILVPDGRVLRCRAETPQMASDWISALEKTCRLLGDNKSR